MKRLLCGIVICLGLASVPLSGCAGVANQVTGFELDNGMQVVVIEDHRAPVVVHMIWYKAGSGEEDPGVSGVAHFLEHLLFKKTKTMDSGEFSRVVAENGGSDNAFTSYDYTGYFQRIAADHLHLVMKMEADRMVNLDLGTDDILIERDVIIEERNQRVESSPDALFGEQRRAALFLNHPYGRPVIGWRHEMEKLGLEDTLAYYHQFYVPNNAVLVVGGDVTPEAVVALAKQTYGMIPSSSDLKLRERPQEPPQTSPRRMTYSDVRVSQPQVTRTYLAPERNPNDQSAAAALTLLAEIFGGGQTSILTQKLQFETQTAVYTSAFYRATALDNSNFGFLIIPSEGVSLEDAETALDQVIDDFFTEGVDPKKLDRLKRHFSASEIYARDNVQGLANAYGVALTSGLRLADIHAWPNVLQAVTQEDIMAAAKLLFRKEKSVTGWLMKAEKDSK